MTLTGDLIHEYEYQEDGQTRLLTVKQNGNTYVCVINRTNDSRNILLILF